jgi:hypothetical protein
MSTALLSPVSQPPAALNFALLRLAEFSLLRLAALYAGALTAASTSVRIPIRVLRVVGVPLWAMRLLAEISRASMGLSSLGHLVERVVQVRAQEQMVRPNAGRIVAVMADDQTLGDRTHRQHIRESMGVPLAALVLSNPISAVVNRAKPKPAALARLNLSPEVFRLVASHG